jgi:hypothetical protein
MVWISLQRTPTSALFLGVWAMYIPMENLGSCALPPLKQSRVGQPPALFGPRHHSKEFLVIVRLHNFGAQVNAFVADERRWPSNELTRAPREVSRECGLGAAEVRITSRFGP